MIERFLASLPPDIPTSPTILDVGSYTGEQACEFATAFPTARIFAFEARPQSAEVVRRTVATIPNVSIIQAAVHEFDGETEFHVVDEGNPGASSLFVGSGVQEIHPIRQTSIRVPTIRLDTWARGQDIEHVDLVWMDLQGADLVALRGMGELLATIRAVQLEITYHELYHGQVMWPEVRAFLESHGMELVDEWPDISGYLGDAVFVRQGSHRI
jgi:FkbM family methyltransferase